ncbi:AzlC family ABC transporter permease [Pannonibacter sp. Pt2-lr]
MCGRVRHGLRPKGLTLAETLLINAFVFAGASQFVAMELYRDPVTPAVLLAMTGIAAAVNLRMLLLGASLRPWLGASPPGRSILLSISSPT